RIGSVTRDLPKYPARAPAAGDRWRKLYNPCLFPGWTTRVHGTGALLTRSGPLQPRGILRRTRGLGRRLARGAAGRKEVLAGTDSGRGCLPSSLDWESRRRTLLARARHAEFARLSRRTWRSETRRLFALSCRVEAGAGRRPASPPAASHREVRRLGYPPVTIRLSRDRTFKAAYAGGEAAGGRTFA